MIKRTISLSILAIALTNCVPQKKYTELETKYADLKKEIRAVTDQNQDLLQNKKQLENQIDALNKQIKDLQTQLDNNKIAYDALVNKQKVLQDAYKALEKNSNDALTANLNKNKELLAQLDAKAKDLAAEQEKLSATLNRLKELENLIANKEAAMQKLKESLSKALNAFEGNGLSVTQRDGKVYVSMENKLLFNSGSWAVGAEGRKAIAEIANVLAENPTLSVLIEGHTDNVPYEANGPIADNWDLSTKRATAIVNLLSENKRVNKQNLTAAGRSEYAPIASNATAEGKSKNRRIEIILTPKLDEINKALNEL